MATINKFHFYQLKLVGFVRSVKILLGFKVPPFVLDDLENKRQVVLDYAELKGTTLER